MVVGVPLLVACGVGPPPIASVDVKPAASSPPLAVETPCDAPARVLGRAKRDLALVVYAPADGAVVATLRAITARWAPLTNGHLKVEFVDSSTEEGREAAKAEGLVADEHGVTGVAMTYGDQRDSVKRLAADRVGQAEALLLLKVREVLEKADGVKLRVGVVTGHDEIALSEPNLIPASSAGQTPNIATLLTQYFPMLELVNVDLGKGDADGSLAALVVTQPQRDWTDAELRRLDAFVMRGKHLVVASSAVELAYGDATMHAKLTTHGLEKLLSGYGVQQRKDIVLDYRKNFTVQIFTSSGPQVAKFPPLLDVVEERLEPTFLLATVQQVSFPLASSLVLDPKAQPDARFRVVARSTAESARETSATVDLSPMRRWTHAASEGEQIVGAVVEGTLKSAFGPGKSQRPAHVAVLSSSQLFANPLARAGAPPKPAPAGLMVPHGGGDETLEQLAMPYAQQQITNTILAAKVMIVDWAAHDEDVSCVLR